MKLPCVVTDPCLKPYEGFDQVSSNKCSRWETSNTCLRNMSFLQCSQIWRITICIVMRLLTTQISGKLHKNTTSNSHSIIDNCACIVQMAIQQHAILKSPPILPYMVKLSHDFYGFSPNDKFFWLTIKASIIIYGLVDQQYQYEHTCGKLALWVGNGYLW